MNAPVHSNTMSTFIDFQGSRAGSLFTQQPQPVLANRQVPVVCGFDRLLIPTVDGVVFQEVLDTLGRPDVVRRDQVQVGRLHHDLESGSADPPSPLIATLVMACPSRFLNTTTPRVYVLQRLRSSWSNANFVVRDASSIPCPHRRLGQLSADVSAVPCPLQNPALNEVRQDSFARAAVHSQQSRCLGQGRAQARRFPVIAFDAQNRFANRRHRAHVNPTCGL